MYLTVENLWLVYGLTLLVMAILALLAKRNKPETNLGAYFAVITFITFAFILLLASATFNYATATEDQLNNLNMLYWVSGGLFVLALIWAFVEMRKQKAQVESVTAVALKVECDENEGCKLKSVSKLNASPKGVHFMRVEEEEDDSKPMSPIGSMRIKYLA